MANLASWDCMPSAARPWDEGISFEPRREVDSDRGKYPIHLALKLTDDWNVFEIRFASATGPLLLIGNERRVRCKFFRRINARQSGN